MNGSGYRIIIIEISVSDHPDQRDQSFQDIVKLREEEKE
ncbi:hypothetical protein JOE21_000053 [Desmospora profundinema]|uniref:Uncharacterized protein n=1 Tax=Desmospora profundinema TaxID=1571184 RepID=A0ABU1IJQ9_9BACL|nr:hypothetical protein [Desmospora profundinema]